MVANPALIIDRETVQAVLSIDECIDTIEHAFRQYGVGKAVTPGVLGTHVDGGGFHVKTAGLVSRSSGRSMFAAKVNANFPANPTSRGLPTIQGVIALFDAVDGRVLAILDSIEITSIRTAAATAVAARYLARDDAATVTICGCGEQGRSQLRALARVRPIHHVWAFDIDHEKAERFAHELHGQLDAHITAVREIGAATRDAAIWVTCTPARRWFVGREHVAPGTFIAAVGADNAEKQEKQGVGQTVPTAGQEARTPGPHPVGSGREQTGDGNDGVPFSEQEQSVSTAAYPGIGISAGQLTQRLLLHTPVQ